MDETTDLGQIVKRATTVSDAVRTDADGRRVYTALAYDTTSVDRHGTTMTNGALRMADGGAPVLLFHKSDTFPVGRVTGWLSGPQGPEVEFVLHGETDEARTAQRLVDLGFLRGVSVGFIPTKATAREDGVIVYTEAELVELSLTPVPSSRLALVDLKRSIDDLIAELPTEDAPAIEEERCIEGHPCECAEADPEPAAETEQRDIDIADSDEAATVTDETSSAPLRVSRLRRLA